MILIDKKLLNAICVQASENERLRKNYNFHETLDAPAQRLLNALQPDTKLPIHRHTHTAETYILLQGKLRVLCYNFEKELTDSVVLGQEEGRFGIHVPVGQWHTIEVLEPDTVLFEVKDGPYIPLSEENIL